MTYWGNGAEMQDAAKRINAVADFDHPFILDGSTVAGRIFDADGFYAPRVVHDDSTDITLDGSTVDESEWEAITGATGQEGYNGAVLHSSEFIGSGLAETMHELASEVPQVFVIVSCEVEASDDEIYAACEENGLDSNKPDDWSAACEIADQDQEPAGWVILYRPAIPFRCMF